MSEGCCQCGKTVNSDDSPVTWVCCVCERLVCRDHTLTIPGSVPLEYYEDTLCSLECLSKKRGEELDALCCDLQKANVRVDPKYKKSREQLFADARAQMAADPGGYHPDPELVSFFEDLAVSSMHSTRLSLLAELGIPIKKVSIPDHHIVVQVNPARDMAKGIIFETPRYGTGTENIGTKQVLHQMAHIAWRERLDVEVHHWARKITDPLPTIREKVQALVDAFRANARLHSHPVGNEVLFSPAQVLFEDRSFDSDDVTIALGAACMSIGIHVKVILSSYKEMMHAYFAVRDEKGEWLKVDATTNLPVGQAFDAGHEMEKDCEECSEGT